MTIDGKFAGGQARPGVQGLLRGLRAAGAALYRTVRSSELLQIAFCAVLGALVGAMVDGLRQLIELLHRLAFALDAHGLLSASDDIDAIRILLVPLAGGAILGAIAAVAHRNRNREIVDPIEANALYGGRMSLWDSIRLGFQALISNAAGASVGMEAGYSQLGSGLFSAVGQRLRLRREDERIFVTAGAAAAIAAAFNAPLAGAFYGFELVLGQYTIRALTPVAVAAVAATLMQDAISHPAALFHVSGFMQVDTVSYLLFALLGISAAGLGVLTMVAVTWSERLLRWANIQYWMRPAIGGVALSAIALACPQVLGSGHGAIQYHFDVRLAFLPLALLVLAKLCASAVSIGSGFRGGLFSASLLLGCVFGGAFAQGLALAVPSIGMQYNAFMLVGMGSVAAAIVGAPFTMVFLVLEGTGDFPLTIGVIVGVVTASTIVRLGFGYSFATWRFHQRGLGIRGAHDIGWIADLSVGRLMRSDPKIVQAETTIANLRKSFPAGSAKTVFVVAANGAYLGSVDLASVHDPARDATAETYTVAGLARKPEAFLYPHQNVRTALLRFEETESEVLPVLGAGQTQGIAGYLTESYALKRYAQELERRRSAELGEQDIFSIGPMPAD